MLKRIYNYFFESEAILYTEVNTEFYWKIIHFQDELRNLLKNDETFKNTFYIEGLREEVNELLHDYQNILPTKMKINVRNNNNKNNKNKNNSEQKYKTPQFFKEKQKERMIEEAVIYVNKNRKEALPKLLEVYSYLEYHYHLQLPLLYEDEIENYAYYGTKNANIFINKCGFSCTLDDVIKALFTYEINLLDDPNNYSEYKTIFCNRVLFEILKETIWEISEVFEIGLEKLK